MPNGADAILRRMPYCAKCQTARNARRRANCGRPTADGQLRDGQLRDGQLRDGQLRDGQLRYGQLRYGGNDVSDTATS
jgi:hypothetical protein